MDSWDYEEFLDLIDYRPEKNSFFDIWQHEGVTEPVIQEGVIHSENLDQYLSGIPDLVHDRHFFGGIRLIYSYIDSDTDCSDKTVFWSRPDFVKIMEYFRLPKRFTQMIGRCHCFFAKCLPDRPDSEEERFSYIFSTMFHHCPFWCVAASWDPESNITYAFLHCTSDPKENSIPRIKHFLTKMVPLAMHPMLLPVLIIDLETNLTLGDDERWTREINSVENETRQRPDVTSSVDPLDLDLPSIVQQLNGCSVFLSLIERESEAVLLHLDQARGVILDLQSTSIRLVAPSRTLIRHVDFLINSRKNLFLRLQNLQRRSQTQLAFTYNFLAQRDNKVNIEVARDSKIIALASSRDSYAMKTVAILTIAFLPGTFVASFFAMPLFDWQGSSKSEIVGPYFWLYWAFAIPLTALVLGAWAVWIRVIVRKHEKQDDEVRARSLHGLISNESVAERSVA